MTKTIDALVEALETITLACHLDALTQGKGTHVDESVLRVADEALAQARAEQAEPVACAGLIFKNKSRSAAQTV